MKRAFTLIELLVVIAIIAILAAILFPVFAQAKVAAKKAVEVSQTKQLGLACIMYAGDYDDTFPLAYRTDATPAVPAGGFPYSLSVYPYVKNMDLYVTPAGKPNGVTNPDWDYIWSYGSVPLSQLKKYDNYLTESNSFTRVFNVVGVKYNGLMGWAQADASIGVWGDYGTLWTGPITVPSKSQSALKSVSDQALIFSAGEPFADHATTNWDGGAPLQGPLGRCANLRRGYNPGSRSFAGPIPRWGGLQSCTGWYDLYPGFKGDYPEANAAKLKDGTFVVVYADGHTKASSMGNFLKTEDCGDGTRCFTALQPY